MVPTDCQGILLAAPRTADIQVLRNGIKTLGNQCSEFDKNRFVQPNDIAESIFSIYNMSSGSTVEEIIIRPQLGDI